MQHISVIVLTVIVIKKLKSDIVPLPYSDIDLNINGGGGFWRGNNTRVG